MLMHQSLLDAYVQTKDRCCPALIHAIYQPNAVLNISLAASAVEFPPLVTDFATRFSQCRTYYVCDALQVNAGRIAYLPYPWLSPQVLDAAFERTADSNSHFRFLRDFTSDKLHWPQQNLAA